MTERVSRRRILAALGTGAVGSTAGCAALGGDSGERAASGGGGGDGGGGDGSCSPYDPLSVSRTTWPAAHGGVDGAGTVAASAVPDGELTQDWRVELDTHVGYHVPVVDDDTVYVHDRKASLRALVAETGEERWRVELDSPQGAPALGGGQLVVSTAAGIESLDIESGRQRWMSDEIPSGSVFGSTPVVDGGTVHIYAGVSVWALDAEDGSVRWRVPIGLSSNSEPAVADETLYVAGDDTYLRALSTADGSERWRHKTGAHVRCNVALAGATVYVASDTGVVTACSRADGTERWRYRFPADADGRQRRPETLAADGARVYVTADSTLSALDAASGGRCWTTNAYIDGYGSGVAVGDGRVFVPASDADSGSRAGGVVFDAATGEQRQSFGVESERGFDVGPSIAGGAVYATGNGAVRRFS